MPCKNSGTKLLPHSVTGGKFCKICKNADAQPFLEIVRKFKFLMLHYCKNAVLKCNILQFVYQF
nr:MAG TPA: hypothetical protein [Caudoviricetes sp.]